MRAGAVPTRIEVRTRDGATRRVAGSIIADTRLTLSAGKPPHRACS